MQTEAAIARHPERSKAESNCEATTSLGAVGISRGRQINLAQILRGGVFLVVILERSEESREKTPCSRMTPKGVGRAFTECKRKRQIANTENLKYFQDYHQNSC